MKIILKNLLSFLGEIRPSLPLKPPPNARVSESQRVGRQVFYVSDMTLLNGRSDIFDRPC